LAREVAPQNQYVARLAFVLAVLTDSLSLHKSVALAMTPGPLSLALNSKQVSDMRSLLYDAVHCRDAICRVSYV